MLLLGQKMVKIRLGERNFDEQIHHFFVNYYPLVSASDLEIYTTQLTQDAGTEM